MLEPFYHLHSRSNTCLYSQISVLTLDLNPWSSLHGGDRGTHACADLQSMRLSGDLCLRRAIAEGCRGPTDDAINAGTCNLSSYLRGPTDTTLIGGDPLPQFGCGDPGIMPFYLDLGQLAPAPMI